MKIIRYEIPKNEKIMLRLLLLIPFSYMTIFSFDMFQNFSIYISSHIFRYIIYISCFSGCFWASKKYLIFKKTLFDFIYDEKLIVYLPTPKKSQRISLSPDSVTQVIISKKDINIFFIKKSKENILGTSIEENSVDNAWSTKIA